MIPEAKVPCGGCRACCKGRQLLTLFPEHGDDPHALGAVPYGPGWRIPHDRKGNCIHLGPEGCRVYENRPAVCRQYDCRRQLLSRPGLVTGPVRRAALARLHTLPEGVLRIVP